jgi:hypothetical protein
MRTKTLLLIAAVGAASVASSMAQVYSVNAVGYVNKTVPGKGFALIANPLKATDNSIAALFAGVPDGTKVFKYIPGVGGGYKIAQFDELEGAFTPADVAKMTVNPGEGVFVQNPLATPLTITFVGEVPQGQLDTTLVPGFQIVSSQVPQAGTLTQLGYTPADGDKVFQFITNDTTTPANNQKYYISQYDDLGQEWAPPLKQLDVGEAVFLQKLVAGKWSRNFNVNQ